MKLLHHVRESLKKKESANASGGDWVEEILSGGDAACEVSPQCRAAFEKFSELKTNIKLSYPDMNSLCKDKALEDSSDDLSTFDISDLRLPQIFYCSRTHSQISQFIGEIRRTCYSSVRCISLASRAHMCINSSVNSSKSDLAISEKCLELQRKSVLPEELDLGEGDSRKRQRSSSHSNSCPFHNSSRESRFVEHSFGKIRDIEELADLGTQIKACPYYGNHYCSSLFDNFIEGSRAAIKAAQVICLPYTMILSKEQRNSLGISLAGNIIIFDEAHNIVDAANNIHSAEITTHELRLVTEILENYSCRYRGVLSGKNLYNIQILKDVVNSLLEKIQQLTKTETLDQNYHSLVMNTNDFLFRFGLDNINILHLCKHAREIHLVQKLASSTPLHEETIQADLDPNQIPTEYSSLKALRSLFQFLLSLCNRDSDGRIFLVGEPGEFLHFHIRFALINPSTHFQEIIDQARCVLFLGGTLQPFSLISSQLFPHLLLPSQNSPRKSLIEFSCDHIVSSSHINATVVTHGPSGCPLNFRYASRETSTLLSDLYEILAHINRIVSYGVVIFFPSYSYLDFVLHHWKSSSLGLFRQLQALKPIYVDTRNSTSGVGNHSDIWRDYSTAATTSPRGACLFSVIGGRLSEGVLPFYVLSHFVSGINFTDNLARCVAIVGMPYPDRNDPVLKEKLRYSESIDPGSGKLLYDSLCMRAVNQSIGRSIRHLNDYASIVLLDTRYSQNKIIELLPSWISKNVTVTDDTRVLAHSLHDFVNRFRSTE